MNCNVQTIFQNTRQAPAIKSFGLEVSKFKKLHNNPSFVITLQIQMLIWLSLKVEPPFYYLE